MGKIEKGLLVALKDVKEKVTLGGAVRSRTLINDETTGAENFSLLVNTMQAGLNCNYTGEGHEHDVESCLYVLSGTGGISINGTIYKLRPEIAVFVPKHAVHYVFADESDDLTYIMIYAPSGPEKEL